MARGGPRQGTPGKAYAQRTDMHQAVQAASGQPYGVRGQQEAAQKAVPLPLAAAAGPAPAASPQPALPGQQAFARPTERPLEPVTAGLPSGPGPGPEALSNSAPDTIGAQIMALYQTAPNNDLLRLLELHQRGF